MARNGSAGLPAEETVMSKGIIGKEFFQAKKLVRAHAVVQGSSQWSLRSPQAAKILFESDEGNGELGACNTRPLMERCSFC